LGGQADDGGEDGAYGVARVVCEPATLDSWSRVPETGRFVDILQDVPGPSERIPGEELVDVAVALAKRLRRVFQEFGFDYFLTADGGTYLRVT
jgi:hypothetical protein